MPFGRIERKLIIYVLNLMGLWGTGHINASAVVVLSAVTVNDCAAEVLVEMSNPKGGGRNSQA